MRPKEKDGKRMSLFLDEYVRDAFGNRFTVIDRVERLPEKPPQIFMSRTK
jgi:hypothetical protein